MPGWARFTVLPGRLAEVFPRRMARFARRCCRTSWRQISVRSGQRAPDNGALRRYDEVARLLTGNAGATAAEGVDWIRKLVSDLQVIAPRGWGGIRVRKLSTFGPMTECGPGLTRSSRLWRPIPSAPEPPLR